MAEQVRIRELIPAILAKCGGMSELRQSCGEELYLIESTLLPLMQSLAVRFLQILLSDEKYWTDLALKPRRFKGELNRLLALIEELMKSRYNVYTPRHRPVGNAARDLRIVSLRREHPGWTHGQLGREMGLPAKTIERVLKRQAEKDRLRLKNFLNKLADLHDRFAEAVPTYTETSDSAL